MHRPRLFRRATRLPPRTRAAPAFALAALLSLSGCASAGAGGLQASAKEPAAEDEAFGRRTLSEIRAAALPADAPPTSAADPADEIEPTAVPIAGTELVRGRAAVEVSAPLAAVRAAVLGFARYPDFMPHYRGCRVLGRTPDGARDVYMEIEALHGAVEMWARVHVAKSTAEDGAEAYEATLVEGNVADFKAIWRLRPVSAARTELSLEVFLKPKLPLPARLLNDENLDGAVAGVLAMRDRVEQAGAAR